MKIKKWGWICLIAAVLLIIFGVKMRGDTEKSSEFGYNENASVRSLSICYGLDQETGAPVIPDGKIMDINRLFVCGYLESGWPIFLGIYWSECDSDKVINEGPLHTKFDPGYFSSKLDTEKIRSPIWPGKYCVMVYHGHNLLATTQFELESLR